MLSDSAVFLPVEVAGCIYTLLLFPSTGCTYATVGGRVTLLNYRKQYTDRSSWLVEITVGICHVYA